MNPGSTQPTCSPSEHSTRSPAMPSHRIRESVSDADNLRAQNADCTFSHKTEWGKAAAIKFVSYGKYLGDKLYHTDTVADFGGNDGYAAYQFYLVHKIKPIVVECDPAKIEHADKVYKLPT